MPSMHATTINNPHISHAGSSHIVQNTSTPRIDADRPQSPRIPPPHTPISSDVDSVDLSDSDDDLKVHDAFRRSYAAFDDNLKWRLPSGTTVEDVFYDAYLTKHLSSSLRATIYNWVVDLGSVKMRALFSKADWAAIRDQVSPLAPADSRFAQYLDQFSNVGLISRPTPILLCALT
jgi:hypothetical protein